MSEYKRLWVLGDVHWGAHNTKYRTWMDMMDIFFHNHYIPFLEENYQEGDAFLQLGDWFDNQSNINVRVMNSAMNVMTKIASIMPSHYIVGNHDIWGKSDVEKYNSLNPYKFIPNVNIHDQPASISVGGKKAVILPWYHEKEDEQKMLKKYSLTHDICFCHSDLCCARATLRKDLSMRKKDIMSALLGSGKLELSDFDGYERVYSGHIHIRHSIDDVFHFVGSPYHLNANDADNDKGWILVDEKGDEFWENKVSPRFMKFAIDSSEDLFKIQEKVVKNNYCDLVLSGGVINSLSPDDRKIASDILRLPWRTFKTLKTKEQIMLVESAKEKARDIVGILDHDGLYDIMLKSANENTDKKLSENVKVEIGKLRQLMEQQ